MTSFRDSEAFHPNLNTDSPIWGYLSCIAEHGEKDQVPAWIRKGVSSPAPDFHSLAEHFANTSPANRYLIQTSKAATVAHAGLKVRATLNPPGFPWLCYPG
jgi:Gly-Xaa carboxypeptidase